MLGHTSPRRRGAFVTSWVSASALGGALLVASPAHALGAPGGLSETTRNSTTQILSWAPVRKATSYEVQVDSDGSFGAPDFATTTVNTRVVPTRALPTGQTFWRVRSISGGTRSGWSNGSFTIAPVTTPLPLAPANGAPLNQPGQPPLLQWSGVQGATSYSVEVDADSDMIGAKTYTTKSTSLVVPDPLTAGDWFWRVTASKGNGLNSLPSTVQSFDVRPLAAPQITYPIDDINQTVEDVVLDWTPVPGATTYDVQVSTDQNFNNIALNVTNIRSTRYSPSTTLNSDQFWWRVRAVDPAGQQTAWTATLYGFKRVWPQAPQPVYPLGSTSSPPAISGTKAFYQWTPVKHATEYQLQVSTDANFSPAVTRTCKTAQTTYTPRSATDCAFPSGTDVLYWRVRPLDLPYPNGGLPGIYSEAQAFTYTPPSPPAGSWDPNAEVSGLKIGVNGTGATSGQGCSGSSPDNVCDDTPSTPVLSWNPVPGAGAYLVYYAQDGNFTTTEIPHVPVTTNTIFQLNTSDSLSALPDSQAGTAYYWHVRPCTTTSLATCGPDPVSSATVLPDTRSFRKASPAIAGLTSSNPNSSEITFSWDDYHDTNAATTWQGEASNQTAKNYRIQVDNDNSFASPIDTQVVDQATYTEWTKLYPDGTYWWRVQALDDENQGLSWSTPHSFTKVSPAVSLTSPVGGTHVAGTTPFRWGAAPFAASYNVEVYKNNDLTFSSANRVVSATVKTTAYVPSSPLPASSASYVWRVRRIDASNNPGPWSTTGKFYSKGAAPGLVRPRTGVWVSATRSLFEWTEVPGATSYQLAFSGDSTSKYTTAATAYAPTGKLGDGSYTWRVTAFDAAGHPLATSAARTFRVDGTAPQVVSVTPTSLTPKSVIKTKFSERVHGVSGRSMKLFRVVHKTKKRVAAVVSTAKKGKIAKLDPKHRLKRGKYLLLFVAPKIKDRAGNRLVPSSVTPALKAAVIRQ